MKESQFKGLFFVWLIICLAGMVGGIYVAVHFIQKYW